MQDVFERVTRQAEMRGAQHERTLAERRQLEWQRALVMRLLLRRFGEVPEHVALHIEGATVELLDRYAERLVVATSVEGVIADE